MKFQGMQIRLLCMGKTDDQCLARLLNQYRERITRYTAFGILEIPSPKRSASLPVGEIQKQESTLLLDHISPDDYVILLDKQGQEVTSTGFADLLNKLFLAGGKALCFVTGGAYGVDPRIKKRAAIILSFSRMTFPHQLIRLIFAEQLYRALTILRNEGYHHE